MYKLISPFPLHQKQFQSPEKVQVLFSYMGKHHYKQVEDL